MLNPSRQRVVWHVTVTATARLVVAVKRKEIETRTAIERELQHTQEMMTSGSVFFSVLPTLLRWHRQAQKALTPQSADLFSSRHPSFHHCLQIRQEHICLLYGRLSYYHDVAKQGRLSCLFIRSCNPVAAVRLLDMRFL
jgi:hypothetical protein